MSIERIFTRTKRRAPQVEHARVRVVAGRESKVTGISVASTSRGRT
jgi:hypothetical protein